MALGSDTFSFLGGAASDLFAGLGDKAKAQGDFLEAQNYTLAATLAKQNAAYTEQSTAIKEAQTARSIALGTGETTADVAGAGFGNSGSSFYLLADAAAQGRLTQQVLEKQGQITEAGYNEQAQSYTNMAQAATIAGNAENQASTFSDITGVIKGVAAVASIFTGGLSGAVLGAGELGGSIGGSDYSIGYGGQNMPVF